MSNGGNPYGNINEQIDGQNDNVLPRRKYLAGTTLALLPFVAGCMADPETDGSNDQNGGTGGNNGETEVGIATTGETTSLYTATQNASAILSENTDLFVDVQPSDGTSANAGILERNEADIGLVESWMIEPLIQGEPPFDNISYELNQLVHTHYNGIFLLSNDPDMTSMSDIQSDTRVAAGPSGSTSLEMMTRALDYTVDDYQLVEEGFGNMGTGMAEGRIDVGVGAVSNNNLEAGWVEQMKASTDYLQVLTVPEDARDQVRDNPRMSLTETDMTQFDGYSYAPDTFEAITGVYYFAARNDADYDRINSFLESFWEYREEIDDAHALFEYSEDDTWTRMAYEDVPFHPAAADLYEEVGIWDDDLTRGEE